MKMQARHTSAASIAIALSCFLPLLSGCSHAHDAPTQTVVFATTDVPLAQVILPQDLEEKQMDEKLVPANAVHDINLAAGRYSRGIKRGEAITTRYIVPSGGLVNPILPSVVYAKVHIPAGSFISQDALEEKPMTIEQIPGNIYECNKKTFEKTYAKKDIKPGEMLSYAMFTPEQGRHYIFATRKLPAGSTLSRTDFELEDPPSLNYADALTVETLLQFKLKKEVQKGKQITIRDLN
jgi:flagella basal body P-ring formation protein FlgA